MYPTSAKSTTDQLYCQNSDVVLLRTISGIHIELVQWRFIWDYEQIETKLSFQNDFLSLNYLQDYCVTTTDLFKEVFVKKKPKQSYSWKRGLWVVSYVTEKAGDWHLHLVLLLKERLGEGCPLSCMCNKYICILRNTQTILQKA